MKRVTKGIIVFGSILLIASSVIIPTLIWYIKQPNNLQIWFENSLTRVSKTAETNDKVTYHLYAAKGEYESFQIIVQAIDSNLRDVKISISDFISNSTSISKNNVDFFYEHYIEVLQPTPWFQAFTSKWYPDALIPFFHPDTGNDIIGGQYDGYPFGVEEGLCQPVWIDVYIPRNVQAGNYTATVTTTGLNDKNQLNTQTNEITLTVWDFVLPLTASLQTQFQISHGYLYEGHNVDDQPAEDLFWKELMNNYKEEIFKHRTTPNGITYYMPQPLDNGTPNWGGGAEELFYEELHTCIEEYHASAIDFYYIPYDDIPGADHDKVINYVGGIYEYLKQYGWEDLLFIYVDDEPNTEEDYERVRDICSTLKEIDPDIRCFVTEQFEPQNASWGSLIGYVNLWCPQWGFITREEVLTRQATGDEAWLYSFPYIDYPIATHRKLAWRLEHFNLTGYQMYCVNNWFDVANYDPWTETANLYDSLDRPYNKNGELFYPGVQAGLPLYPISSIRYKVIRDSMEDYDYFQLLKQTGKVGLCQSYIDTIINGWNDPDGWLTDPSDILSLRLNIAREIIG